MTSKKLALTARERTPSTGPRQPSGDKSDHPVESSAKKRLTVDTATASTPSTRSSKEGIAANFSAISSRLAACMT